MYNNTRVHPIHVTNYHMAVDPQTTPTHLDLESTSTVLLSMPTIAIITSSQ